MAKFVFSFILFVSLFVQASDLTIRNPEEFQFVHCVTSFSNPNAKADHFVIDIRNENKHALYFDRAAAKTAAKNLKKLKLIDADLEVNTLKEFDVSWISKVNSLQFQLNIIDNGGYAMDGDLVKNGNSTPVSCTDSSLE